MPATRGAFVSAAVLSWRVSALALSYAWNGLLELLYPSCCWLCGGRPDPDTASLLCAPCREQGILPVPSPMCPGCAGTLDGLGVCHDCFGAAMPFERVVAAGAFKGSLRDIVHGLKFGARWYLALPAAELLSAQLAREVPILPTHVVPVPLVLSRRLRRGYNQAGLIGAELARKLGLAYAPHALRRRGWRAARQARLGRAQRIANMRGAFRIGRALPPGASVLLVDDVVTTTRTIHEATTVLRNAGVARIVVATVARASLKHR